MLSEKLPVNRRLLAKFQGSQKLYANFLLHQELSPYQPYCSRVNCIMVFAITSFSITLKMEKSFNIIPKDYPQSKCNLQTSSYISYVNTTTRILYTGSFSDNISNQLGHILYVACIIYFIFIVKLEKRKYIFFILLFMKVTEREKEAETQAEGEAGSTISNFKQQ